MKKNAFVWRCVRRLCRFRRPEDFRFRSDGATKSHLSKSANASPWSNSGWIALFRSLKGKATASDVVPTGLQCQADRRGEEVPLSLQPLQEGQRRHDGADANLGEHRRRRRQQLLRLVAPRSRSELLCEVLPLFQVTSPRSDGYSCGIATVKS